MKVIVTMGFEAGVCKCVAALPPVMQDIKIDSVSFSQTYSHYVLLLCKPTMDQMSERKKSKGLRKKDRSPVNVNLK